MDNNNLQELQGMIAQYKQEQPDKGNQLGLEELFLKTIVNDNLKTMAISYDAQQKIIKLQIIYNIAAPSKEELVYYQASDKAYLQFCKEVLGIDTNRNFNDSKNKLFDGVPARIFALMPPYKDFPLIVISTAKRIQEKLDTLNPEDEKRLQIAMQGNVLIVGASGAGKTTLLNYLLKKYTPDNERIGVIQEFQEIFPPNEMTDIMLIPPRTPGQAWNDLEVITEQTNLMRYDRVIIGEIKGSEAWPFVINCASGTKGTATLHGSSAQKALQRLRTLCLSASSNLSSSVIDGFIKDAIDYIIYVEDFYVKEIMALKLVNNGKFSLEAVEAK